MLKKLKEQVCDANVALSRSGLVILTWGNVSGIARDKSIVAIKPSGISYDELTPDKIVFVDLNGNIVEGKYKPSSDAPTHLELYKNFKTIGGICHTHSTYATAWAQAGIPIPCFGTTHADSFYGSIPVTDKLPKNMIQKDYELNTGKLIVETFRKIDYEHFPGVLVADHGPFVWGKSPQQAVENAIILEEIAKIALLTKQLNPSKKSISKALRDKHFFRKHGSDAYYGQ